ncbi:MAG TPA: hydantoinase/oxoprolinase N-terminal domain-containing protein, partial [Candidatus Polarisedimenticolaceae bacterium]|nr:hydantoinase/oxoprolinase N-terminal domain-containing protein [Candidatus Polarisedimenticolaceae bacterium]
MNGPSPVSIWIDTGGTFTDAVAAGADGTRRSVKILTSGALRGTVARVLDPQHLEIRERWQLIAPRLEGLGFRLLADPGTACVVGGYDPATRTLTLDRPLAQEPAVNAAFELVSPEPSPLFAARLLTGTPLATPLPPARLRLATTLGTNALLERRGA